LVPRRYLSTYLPLTPSEKSYSALISTGLRLDGSFFIVASLMFRCNSSTDQTNLLSSPVEFTQSEVIASGLDFSCTVSIPESRNKKRRAM
jgi:hypothetical protein